jgi:hypothetical protein
MNPVLQILLAVIATLTLLITIGGIFRKSILDKVKSTLDVLPRTEIETKISTSKKEIETKISTSKKEVLTEMRHCQEDADGCVSNLKKRVESGFKETKEMASKELKQCKQLCDVTLKGIKKDVTASLDKVDTEYSEKIMAISEIIEGVKKTLTTQNSLLAKGDLEFTALQLQFGILIDALDIPDDKKKEAKRRFEETRNTILKRNRAPVLP